MSNDFHPFVRFVIVCWSFHGKCDVQLLSLIVLWRILSLLLRLARECCMLHCALWREKERERERVMYVAMTSQDCLAAVSLSLKRKNNFKVRARALAGTLASLKAQVKELEQHQDFLSLWKADTHTGADVEGSLVDIEFQGLDGGRVHAHRAVLVSLFPLVLLVSTRTQTFSEGNYMA